MITSTHLPEAREHSRPMCWALCYTELFPQHLLMVPPTLSESPLVALQPSSSHFKMLPSIWAFNSDHACHRIGLKGVDQMQLPDGIAVQPSLQKAAQEVPQN